MFVLVDHWSNEYQINPCEKTLVSLFFFPFWLQCTEWHSSPNWLELHIFSKLILHQKEGIGITWIRRQLCCFTNKNKSPCTGHLIKWTLNKLLVFDMINRYRSGTVNSKSFVGKVLLQIKQKFELN